jgi:hypothetical protein
MARAAVCVAIGAGAAIAASCGGEEARDRVPTGAADATTDSIAPPPPPADAGPPDPCAPPADPTKAALCIAVVPEAISFVPGDPKQDGVGVMTLRLYARAQPEADAGDAAVSDLVVLPPQRDGGPIATMSLAAPIEPVRFDGLAPGQVYARVLFVDDFTAFNAFGAGWWAGGLDLSRGVVNLPLAPVALQAGQGKTVRVDLLALRRLTVTMTRATSIAPIGNGQGPVLVYPIEGNRLTAGLKVFGLATSPCGDISGASAAIANGWVIGKGPYFLAGWVDDFDAGGYGIGPGALVSVDVGTGGVVVPAANEVTYAPSAYSVAHTIRATYAVPIDAGPDGAVDNVTCP